MPIPGRTSSNPLRTSSAITLCAVFGLIFSAWLSSRSVIHPGGDIPSATYPIFCRSSIVSEAAPRPSTVAVPAVCRR